MRFLRHNRSRAILLIIGLALIGGIGCASISSFLHSVFSFNYLSEKRRKDRIEEKQRQFEDDKVASARGDLPATTRLGLSYLRGYYDIDIDAPKGISLLEQAVSQHYGPAEYALGGLLISDRLGYRVGVSSEKLPMQTSRGINLLKQSASSACSFPPIDIEYREGHNPAREISDLYRFGRYGGLAIDMEQADLWLARSIIHCQHPSAAGFQSWYMRGQDLFSSPLPKITLMALFLLMPQNDREARQVIRKIQAVMSESEMQAVQEKMIQLRQAVAESEKQYPAPPPNKS